MRLSATRIPLSLHCAMPLQLYRPSTHALRLQHGVTRASQLWVGLDQVDMWQGRIMAYSGRFRVPVLPSPPSLGLLGTPSF